MPDVKLLILVSRDERADLSKLIGQQAVDVRARIQVIESNEALDQWAQDTSKPIDLPLAALSGNFARQSHDPPTTQATLNAIESSGAIDFKTDSPFAFQGGDIIVGDKFVLMGAKTFNSYGSKFGRMTTEQKIRVLSRLFDKPVRVVGLKNTSGKWAPWSFHIDLDMVLAVDRVSHRDVALVQSPELLLKTLLPGSKFSAIPTYAELSEARKKIVRDLREKAERNEMVSSGELAFANFIVQLSAKTLQSEILKSRLFQRSVRAQGYAVREIPGLGLFDGKYKGRSFFFGTNAILSGRTAIIPDNLFPALDSAIRGVYEKLGYETISMKSSAVTILNLGGIRCATETFRKPYLPMR